MSDIVVCRTHQLPKKRARAAAERIAEELAREYDLRYDWDGDTMHFRRLGVTGTLALTRHQAEIRVRLGFLLFALRPSIEQEIHTRFDAEFGHQGRTQV